jgi:hypothetical protein
MTRDERRQRIHDIMEKCGVGKMDAEEILSIELGESKGDCISDDESNTPPPKSLLDE